MSAEPTREQKPLYNLFRRLVSDDKFINDIELLRASEVDIFEPTYENLQEFDDGTVGADEIPSLLHQVMMKYNLPLVMEDFVRHYVVHNEVALDTLHNGVYIVDNKTMEASGGDNEELNYHRYVDDIRHNKYVEVTLAIPVHATTTQINDTIKQYKQFIKDRQTLVNDGEPVRRVKLRPMELRNKEIVRLHGIGLKPREILWQLPESLRDNLTAPDISKIIDVYKKNH